MQPHNTQNENANDKITLTTTQFHDMITRVRINQMQQCGWDRKKIKQELGINDSTITRWSNVGFNDLQCYVERPRTGRPEVPIAIEKSILKKRTNKTFTPRKVARQLGIHHQTAINILQDAEAKWRVMPKASKLTAEHIKARLKFCKDYQNNNLSWWDKILITYSKIFLLDGGHNPRYHGRWLLQGEEIEIWQVEKFSKGLHVYGGMTSKGLTNLVFIEGGVTAARYVEEVLPMLISVQLRVNETNDVTTTKLFDDNNDWIFEHDHAKAHDSNIAQKFLAENVPSFFNKDETSPKLDDLWCI